MCHNFLLTRQDNSTAVKHVEDKILIVAYMPAREYLKVVSAFLTSKLNIVKNRVKSGKESMKVEYDPEADIMYIKIKEDKIRDTVDLGEDIWADLNEKGEIVGIEIWQARKHIISEVLKYLERAKKVEA